MSARSKPIELLTDGEVQALICTASGRAPSGVRNRAAIALMAYAGLRVGEVVALRVSDVDTERGVVNVRRGKGAKQRVAALLPQGVPLVELWLERRRRLELPSSAPLLCSITRGGNAFGKTRPGRPLTQQYLHAMLQRLARRAGIDKRVHPHGLRHYHAALLDRRGARVTAVRDQLGHADLSTTHTYLSSFSAADRIAHLQHLED